MGTWGKVREARGQRGGIYLKAADPVKEGEMGGDASYRVRILACRADHTRGKGGGQGDPKFVTEMLILSSTQPRRPAGMRVDSVVVFNKDPAPDNVADILRAAITALANTILAVNDGGVVLQQFIDELRKWSMDAYAELVLGAATERAPLKEDEFLFPPTDALTDHLIEKWAGGPDNPLEGIELDVVVWETPNRGRDNEKNKGNPVSRLRWTCPEDVSQAVVARAA